jgi:alkylated DNA repair dioxygenase AlkB
MITDYFKYKNGKPTSIIEEFYEVHRCFTNRNNFTKIYNEIKNNLQDNSTRKSCVMLNENLKKDFTMYNNLPLMSWTETINKFRDKILKEYNYNNIHSIDYGLVHYYHDEKSNINWHSDNEALRSPIFSVSIGGVRRFCLRNKNTKELITIDLYDGDLLIMKVGCQDVYEHCIKSIKEFNKPRISITFRQLENPLCYYNYDRNNLSISITNVILNDNYREIVKTKQGIIIGLIENNNSNSSPIFIIPTIIKENISLIKSNLQKAIRRKNEDVALQSAMNMIENGNVIDLLRRLTIISFEDVYLNKYFPIIVWYYVVLTNGYNLLEEDVSFIYSYVKLLCTIQVVHNYQDENLSNYNNGFQLNDLCNNVNCIALYLRLQYGGFDGEIRLINWLIYGLLNNKIHVNNDNIIIQKYKTYETLTYLDCAIDFHCFPKMPEKVLAKIQTENGLTTEDIKKYIWVFDSNVNERVHLNNKKLDYDLWKNVIKPKCDIYRYYIRKMLNI